MKYKNIVEGVFVSRPNRFIANVVVDGVEQIVHVKNTGRCRELLVKGNTVFLQESDNPDRKTKYDLIAVQKGDRLINMDSQIVNYVALEYIPNLFDNIKKIKPEYKYGNSRIDIYLETEYDKIFIEVKGVTLEEDGVVRFPDAPTLRGVKHIYELIEAKKAGFEANVLFVIQMKGIRYFEPNYKTHMEFGVALKEAKDNGVNVMAIDCGVTKEEVVAGDFVEVKYTE